MAGNCVIRRVVLECFEQGKTRTTSFTDLPAAAAAAAALYQAFIELSEQ